MRVGVVVTTWNDADYLDRCLGSIVGQSRPPDQVVVVNDGSTERLDELATAERGYPQVRFVHQANAGPSAARNRGFAELTTDAVAFVDADDWLAADNLATKSARLDAGGADGVYSGFTAVRPDGSTSRSTFRPMSGRIPAARIGEATAVPGGLHQWLFRADAWRRIGGLDETLTIYEDVDAVIRLSRLGPLLGDNAPLYFRDLRPDSLSRGSNRRRLRGSLQFFRKARRERYFSRPDLALRYATAWSSYFRRAVRERAGRRVAQER